MRFIPDTDNFDDGFPIPPLEGHRVITVKIINDRIFAEDNDAQYVIINRNNGKIKSFLHGDEDWHKSGKVKNDRQAWKAIGHMLGVFDPMEDDDYAASK